MIDRADGEVKVLEAPAGVFRDFRNFYNANGIDPGGNDGVDFMIEVKGEGLMTRYVVSYKVKPAPFTADEKKKITFARENGYVLDEIFKATPVDKIESVLFGEGAGESKAASTQPTHTPEQSAPQTSAGKDGFEWAV